MDRLREELGWLLEDEFMDRSIARPDINSPLKFYLDAADRILAMPEIAAALTRPTADLGEDGELVQAVRNIAKSMKSDVDEDWLETAADRLELYREALNDIAWDASFQSTSDSPNFEYILETARAVLSRSAG